MLNYLEPNKANKGDLYMNKWTLEYTVEDQDYDFRAYNYVFTAGSIISSDGNEDTDDRVLDYQVNYDINFEKDADLSWDIGCGPDPDEEGELQASIENLEDLLAKRVVVLFDFETGGTWDDPKTHKTVEEAAAFLGCSKEELDEIIAKIIDEADAYLESAVEDHLCNLSYEREEPDYDYDDWYNDYWD
jgi:hypothetical protein